MSSHFAGEAIAIAVIALIFVRPVSRARLERFALRQNLVITVDNGALVLRYLMLTRCWRVGGFAVGTLVAWIATHVTSPGINIGGAGSVFGWFGGAIVAEWWVEANRTGAGHASALLAERRMRHYLPRSLMYSLAVLHVAALGYGLALVAYGSADDARVGVALGVGLVVDVLVWRVARHVLDRPQPLAAPDMVAADDAVRSRSLHVLAGSTVAVAGVAAAMITDADQALIDGPWGLAVIFLGGLAMPIIGVAVAMSPFAARRGAVVQQRVLAQ